VYRMSMKKISFVLLTILCSILISCGIEPIQESSAIQERSFEDWENNIKLNKDIFESDAHNAYVDIYVNKLAKEPYEKRLGVFPIGSEVYKPLYSDAKKSHLARVVIMIKMQKGYDSKNGDWWYGVTDASGKELWYKGRIQHCIDCHALAKETDYMFSESVMEEIEIQKGLREPEVYLID